MTTFLEFDKVQWARRSFRGSSFGDRNNTFINLKGRGPWVLHCPTGNKDERMIRLTADAHSSFGMQYLKPVFSRAQDGSGTPLDFSNLFLTEDGKDKWPAVGFGKSTLRGADCSMQANTSYYFYIPEIIGGHHTYVAGVRIGYSSRSKDDLDEYDLGEPMIHPFTGQDGWWTPLED